MADPRPQPTSTSPAFTKQTTTVILPLPRLIPNADEHHWACTHLGSHFLPYHVDKLRSSIVLTMLWPLSLSSGDRDVLVTRAVFAAFPASTSPATATSS